jgi:hypothetical protein
MDKSKAAKEEDKKIEPVEPEEFNMMIELIQETERIITEASEVASQEAEQELERILSEYEQNAKQIALRIREKAKSETAEIANRLSEAIMLRIEKASAQAVAGVVSELSIRAGELTRKMQEAAEKEAGQSVASVAVGLGGSVKSADSSVLQEYTGVAEAKADDVSRETGPVTEEEDIGLQQPIKVEDFDQWLTQ